MGCAGALLAILEQSVEQQRNPEERPSARAKRKGVLHLEHWARSGVEMADGRITRLEDRRSPLIIAAPHARAACTCCRAGPSQRPAPQR
jgi:hypothetical protein